MSTHIHIYTGWRRTTGCLKMQVIFANERLIIELFCRKWPISIRYPVSLRHPVLTSYWNVTRVNLMGYTCWSHVSIYMFTCVYTGATMLSKEWLRDGQSVSISRLDLWTDKHIHLIYTCIYVHVSIYTYICRCKYSMKQMATWLFNHSLSLSHTHVPYTYTRSLSPSHMCSLSIYIYMYICRRKNSTKKMAMRRTKRAPLSLTPHAASALWEGMSVNEEEREREWIHTRAHMLSSCSW